MMSDAEVVSRALQILRERGWCKGQGMDAYGHYCVEGAIERASLHNYEATQRVFEEVRKTIREQYNNVCHIYAWNDNPHREFEEVERVLEKTIVRLEEQV